MENEIVEKTSLNTNLRFQILPNTYFNFLLSRWKYKNKCFL